jgi:hypothetical protein
MWHRARHLREGHRAFGVPTFHLSSLDVSLMSLVLRFGYLGKWSPCAYESLSTKGEDFYPHTLLYDSNFTLT